MLLMVGGLATLGAGTASAAEGRTLEQAMQKEKCRIVVGKADPVTGISPVKEDTCDPNGKRLPAGNRAILTPLLTLWSDIDIEGWNINLYGDAGPCDPLGYGFSNLTSQNTSLGGITSFQTWNNCTGQRAYRQAGYVDNSCPFYHGYVTYFVGDWCNDQIRSMKVYLYYG